MARGQKFRTNRRLPPKKVSVYRRHAALYARDALELEITTKKIASICKLISMRRDPSVTAVYVYRRFLLKRYLRLVNPAAMNATLTKIESKKRTIDSFADEDIPINFRFRTKQQLYDILNGFQFPEFVKSEERCVFHREELLLVSLYRYRRPSSTTDIAFKEIFGFRQSRVSIAFRTFVNFLIRNWSYLLLDNMQYWLPKLRLFATAIQQKLLQLGCEFPPPGTPGGFCIFSSVDNTLNAACRPGGGPRRDGINAPRNDPLIQRAFYNGWKKFHGLKWQTVDLPNGMNFHVWGPVSLRHCDLYTLSESDINNKVAALQVGELFQYFMYPLTGQMAAANDFFNNPQWLPIEIDLEPFPLLVIR